MLDGSESEYAEIVIARIEAGRADCETRQTRAIWYSLKTLRAERTYRDEMSFFD
jgi:hypothetical protein